MVKILPFSGTIYNKKKLKNLAKVMSPPYDIISAPQQEELYNMSNFNYVRLILGKEFPGDNEYNNRYVRAAAFIDGWLRHKILLKDLKPALYVYEQKFSHEGKIVTRVGFIGILRLEETGRNKVFPHEETYSRAKLDRFQLMRATNANLDPIFTLYSDKKEKVMKAIRPFMKRKPVLELKDPEGIAHRLWRVDRKLSISKIIQEMKDKAVFIADGHHRYEAAIRLKNEMKLRNTKFTEDEAYNHVMMYFTPLESKGLVILPIHRVVSGLNFFDPIRFEQDLAMYFNVVPYPANKKNADNVRKKLLKDLKKAGETKHAFALYLGQHRYFLLTLKDEKMVEEMVAENKPHAWKTLDVTVLHYTIFDRLLNMAHETEDKVTYFKNSAEAIKAVDEKGPGMAFLLNPTKIDQIIEVAGALEKMPHKSTYFYPKLLSGPVLYRFEPNEKVEL